LKAHELDDGTTEAVDTHPRRRVPTTLSVAETVKRIPGGRLTQVEGIAPETRNDYVTARTQLGASKIAFQHLPFFSALWRLWAAKRADGSDAGVSVAELSEATKSSTQRVHAIVATLIRNNIIRSVRTNVGWANVRASYYPTELGTQMLAMSQALGPGSSVLIGGTATAWGSRSEDEPENFFRHAALMRGSTQNRKA